MTFPRLAWRVALSAAVLAVGVPLALLARAGWDDAQQVKVVIGLTWLATSLLLPALTSTATKAGVVKYTLAATLWGAGTVVAGTYPTAQLGPLHAAHLAHGLSLLGLAAIAVQQLRDARVARDDQPLLIEAGLFGTVMATLAWDGLARAGEHGDGWWNLTTSLVIVVASFVAASTIVLAVEHPKLRVSSIGLAVGAVGTELTAVASDETVALVGIVLAVVGGYTLMVFQPHGGMVRHGGASAARAVRRLRVASVLPAAALLGDVALFVVAPRADGIVFVYFASIVVAAGARYAATARAIDRTHARLSFQALHDQLTGLQNRTALQSALVEPDRTQSLVILEVGGLDDVTDVLGVSTSEEVLRVAGTNLRDHVAALGGSTYRVRHDEFAALLPGTPDEVVHHLPGALAAISAAPLQVPGAGRFPVDAVAGVSCVQAQLRRRGSSDAMVPLVEADLALRAARASAGGLGFAVYSGEVAHAHARRLLLRERLALAVAEGTVDVHYQPIVNFTTGRVEKFEALARWDDAQLGRISPVEFIAVAEESNLVVALGEHVLRRAVGAAHAAGVFAAGVRLAVNVSVVQLQAPGFADIVREILAQYEIPPHLLTLELTESVFLDSDSPAERVVTELAALGCQIAIDDFGTGYSAFGYLDRLPVHVLKVDRSLTQSLTAGGNGRSVVTAVVDLANRLGLTVVVEGVETDEEAAICRSIQAGLGQGWLYSAAVTCDRIGGELQREYPVSPEAVR
jgi:EAL domain-containing protein (putative c-di-GMP-specific phosphodiesterase class I)/GGDEF domain-containing protein